MKTRSSALKITASAFAVLACTLLLAAGVRTIRNAAHSSSAKTAAAVAPSFSSATTSNAEHRRVLDSYGKLPLSFIENQGQTAQEVRYTSHGGQYDLFLTSSEAVIALRHTKRYDMSPRHRSMSVKQIRADRKAAKDATTTTALRMQFENANPNPQISPADKLSGKVNYYIGNDPSKWHVGVATYSRVKYSEVYPGVDLVFYGNQRKLEYDFVVAPGADPSAIRMHLAGARRLHLSKTGDLNVEVPDGNVALQKPVVYQTINGHRQLVDGKYLMNGSHIAFAVGKYDRREPLIIDPVLLYGTYLGGDGDEAAFSIVVDAAGDAFVGGQTDSTDFPVVGAGAVLGINNSGGLAFGFVSVLDPTGSTLLQSTYLGGTSPGGDVVFGLAIDAAGNGYVTGMTFATDFPTTAAKALKPTLSVNANGTSFIAESNASGTLVYSSYLGGNNGDFGNAVAADGSGKAYITGVTYSDAGTLDINFPVSTNARQNADPSGSNAGSAFLTVIDTTKSGAASLGYSSYLGGDGVGSGVSNLGFADEGFGVALDSNNHAYITGTTGSSNFPVSTGAFQSAPGNSIYTAFITEIDATAATGPASLVYSTYLGGTGGNGVGDFGTGIDVQSGTTVAYVTGTTNSANFPKSATPFQATGDGNLGSGYVTLLDTSVGSSLKYSTFLGVGGTTGYSIRADKNSGKAVVTGITASATFPVTAGAFQTALAAGAGGDGFVTELDPSVSGAGGLIYSTYLGGSGAAGSPDQAFGIALGTLPNVFVTGQTFSDNFPTTAGALQTALDGPSDAFVASLNLTPVLPLDISPTSLSFTSTAVGTAAGAQTVTLTNNTATAIPFTSATIVVGTPPASVTDFKATTTCTTVPANAGTCTVTVNYTPSVATTETATLVLTDGGPGSPQSVALTGNVVAPLLTVAPTSLAFTSTAIGTAAGAQTVTLTNGTGTAIPFTSATVVVGTPPASVTDFTATVTPACASVPANGTCTVSVNYTPSVATMETATLVLTDGGSGSPQSVALTGTVAATPADFTISAAPASFSVARGATGTSTITVTAVGDFDAAVTLTCSGAPAKSTCTIAPSSVTPVSAAIARTGAVRHADGDQATATLSLATTRHGEIAPPVSLRFPPYVPRVVVPVFLALLAMLFFFVSDQRLRGRLAAAAVVLFFVVIAGCSGSSGGTPKGTVTLTVTGTAGSITHSTTVSATVTN
jgi:hypothetical protein